MNKRIFIYVFMVAGVLFGVTGCSDSTKPEVEPGVVLNLRSEIEIIDGEVIVSGIVEVENSGQTAVNYPAGCGFLVGLGIEDAGGNNLTNWDPELMAACPPVLHVLPAGEDISEKWNLLWAWDEDGTKYRLPPGSYTIRTSFSYYSGGTYERQDLAKSLSLELY